jgi:hypothetical protein
MSHMTRYVGRYTPPSRTLELTLLLSVSRLQPHTHPLHHTFIQLRINLRYVALMLPAVACANDSSGSMAPPTPVPLMAFRRPIKASSTKLCTATSHCMGMGPVCRSRLMLVTGEPTRMRRLSEEIGLGGAMYQSLGAFRRNLGDWSVY